MRHLSSLSGQRGFMAIVLVVFLVVFVAIAAAIVAMTTSGMRSAGDHVRGSAALYLAESGIEWAALELFDADDPQTDCESLAGASADINDGGSFVILNAEYLAGDEACRVTSRGLANPASRTLAGVIPKRVLDGDEGGGDDLFDDTQDKFNNCGNPNIGCQDGALILRRPAGQAQGNTVTQSSGADLISDTFVIGDEVFFTTNIGWDADPTGNNLRLDMNIATGPNISCSVDLPALTSPCAAAGGHPLYEHFDIVLSLGDYFGSDDVGQVQLRVDWVSNPSSEIILTNGCIGLEGHCAGEGSDDPTDDGGWDENP